MHGSISATENTLLVAAGRPVGRDNVTGIARIIKGFAALSGVAKGDILVIKLSEVEWKQALSAAEKFALLRNAAAFITDAGGHNCCAAIIARELGIPAIVGCGNAGSAIKEGELITVSCAEAKGYVYRQSPPQSPTSAEQRAADTGF